MLTLNYNEGGKGNSVEVAFVHMGVQDFDQPWKPTATQCQLFDPESGDIVAIGEALTHWRDQFNRKTGRKIAFTRALEAAAFDKATRTKLWAQLLEQVTV